MENKLVTKWCQIGFLEGSDNKEQLSEAYEKAMIYLKDNYERLKAIEVVSFPIIAKIFKLKGGDAFDVEGSLVTMLEDLNKQYLANTPNEIYSDMFDAEAVFCNVYAENY